MGNVAKSVAFAARNVPGTLRYILWEDQYEMFSRSSDRMINGVDSAAEPD